MSGWPKRKTCSNKKAFFTRVRIHHETCSAFILSGISHGEQNVYPYNTCHLALAMSDPKRRSVRFFPLVESVAILREKVLRSAMHINDTLTELFMYNAVPHDAGMVDQDTLHDAYARSGFVLYPTAFPGKGLGIWSGCYLNRHSLLLQLNSHTSHCKGLTLSDGQMFVNS